MVFSIARRFSHVSLKVILQKMDLNRRAKSPLCCKSVIPVNPTVQFFVSTKHYLSVMHWFPLHTWQLLQAASETLNRT